jgi:MraZ protein
MEPNGTSKCSYFSRYDFGLDDKNRLQVPSKWRSDDPNFQFVVVIWPKAREGTCLRVMPLEVMNKVMQQLETMPEDNANKPVLKRLIGGGADSFTLDKAGRLTLPAHMIEAAGIKDKAVLIGMLDRFEIWSPERFAKVEMSDSVKGEEAFRMLE